MHAQEHRGNENGRKWGIYNRGGGNVWQFTRESDMRSLNQMKGVEVHGY